MWTDVDACGRLKVPSPVWLKWAHIGDGIEAFIAHWSGGQLAIDHQERKTVDAAIIRVRHLASPSGFTRRGAPRTHQ
jgi:hypothetical protein